MNKPPKLIVVIAILLCKLSFAQPANDNCANAVSLQISPTCSNVAGTLVGATTTSGLPTPSCASITREVWYSFTASTMNPTINLSSIGTNIRGTGGGQGGGAVIQVLSGTCGGSFSNQGTCVTGTTATLSSSLTNLTLGQVYYIVIYAKNNVSLSTNAAFNICITGTQLSRTNEIWQRTVVSNNVINTPWEVTYGPDDYLWVTGSKDYKAYRVNPATGVPTTILDLSDNSTDFPALKVLFNNVTTPVQNPWPQGGFAGLAIHPQFNSGKPYVYISYSRKYNGGSSGPGYSFTNSLVKFTYNSSTDKLESPEIICDTLPGSSDHNSQRIIIAPVNGVDYLFYAQGDMGAGQLVNATRTNNAQKIYSYEGKILRFNLEGDGDAGAYDKWIPSDNPYNILLGKQSAIWAVGIRNNQGFAYNPTTGVLYGASHGPYSDDEINIIEKDKNYGHPFVIGYSADHNYNASSAGVPNSGTSSLTPITDEVAAAAAIPNYKDPLFSGYAPDEATLHNIWVTNPGNAGWPSEAWSGLDVYTNTVIPGWNNSLLIAGLKWGRVLRLKLGTAGNTIVQTNGADTIAYFQSKNRYRDIAFAPNGKDIYVSDEGTSATGPGGVSPPATVPNCTNCIIKYTFLGYADVAGKSTIPSAINVTEAPVSNTITNATTVTIDNTNNTLWVPITGPDGNILAEIKANGNNLGTITTAFYEKSGTTNRIRNGVHYLNRNMTITPQTQPGSPVNIRLYLSKTEFDALKADGAAGINAITDLKILKNSDPISAVISSNTTPITPIYAEAFGTDGYMLQGTISSFSSFYFASVNITLPLDLLTFKGKLQNNATLLEWETANENNTSQFEIERSIDARSFSRIGTVAAAGNSQLPINYKFTDQDVLKQSVTEVYYRLKMIDKDNKYQYSDVVKVTLPFVTSRIKLFPNPANEDVTVTIDAPSTGKAQWKLLDNTGRVMIQSTEMLKKGNNNFSVSISKLSSGIYYFVVSGAGIDQQVKLQKL